MSVVQRWLSGLLAIASFISVGAASSVVGPVTICSGTTNSYSVSTDSMSGLYIWSVSTNNSAGAVILGDTAATNVSVVALTNGSFDLECAVGLGEGYYEIAVTNILVSGLVSGPPLASRTACPGGTVTFSTTVTGGGYTVVWRKDGDVIPDVTTESLTLTNLAATIAGVYSVEVTGACNSFTNFATLELVPPPTLTGPTNVTVQCLTEVPAPDTNSVIATNATAVFHAGDSLFSAECVTTITRTYGAVNSCGATSTWAQIITVSDTTPPMLLAASNLVVEAGAAWAFTEPTVSDNCAGTNLAIQIFGTVTNALCGQTYAVTRTWTASDACGNAGFASQTITILDTTPPAFSGVTNFVVEFGTNWNFLPPQASDIADGTNLTLVIASTTTNATCGNTFTAERVWTATDSCSNSATFAQLVAVVDTTPPSFAGATNRIVEFGTAWDFEAPLPTDIADGTNVTLGVVSTTTNAACGNTFTAERVWIALDSCSNSATFAQLVAVVDTTPPSLTGATNRIVECGTAWDFEAPSVTDIADGTNVLLIVTSTTTNTLCGQTFSATRTWAATDSCSNSAAFTQVVTILDTTPPVLFCITNRIVECGDLWDFLPPTATDVCGGTNVTIAILNTTTNPLVGQTYSATRVWSALDECGNSNTCSQTVTILDRTPPDITCSSNIVVECIGGAGNPVSYTVTAFDGCDTNVTLVVTPPSGSLFSLGTNVVLAVATDDSGNTNVCTFNVVVVDTTPPNIACPPNLIVSEAPRDSGGAAVTFAAPTVLDTCDSAPTMFATPPSGSVFTNGTNTVTWTAVDGSGNSNSCTFTIRVIPYRLFVVSNTADSGSGSLRQAILDSNDAPDDNLIIFNLPGSGPYTINLESPLPPLTSAVTLDGWSQAGSNSPPVVQLSGASNAFDGLIIQSGRSVVRGLSLHGFATALVLEGGTNVIQGNYLGVDVSGINAPGNSADGLRVLSSGNQIGGTALGTGNLISGSGSHGLVLSSSSASNNIVEGNVIGAANDATTPLPNLGHGVFLTNQAGPNRIGGTGSNPGNIIVFNGGAGVALDPSAGSGNAILGNSIWDNTALGIDLGADGVTLNDNDDPDTGANLLQNYPILSDARSFSGMTVVDGQLASMPNTTYRVEFFLNDVADPSTNGEGRVYVGSTLVEVKGNGVAYFSATFPLTAVYTQFISTTTTDPEGNTSEYSPVVQVRTPPIIEQQPQSTNSGTGESVTFCAQVTGTPPIQFQWRLNGVNITGATNACYTIPSTELADGGTYTVVVKNDLAAFASTTASLILGGSNILSLATGDNFVDALDISIYGGGTNGTLVGNNALASLEPFEPKHAGKNGGRSVWYRWRTPDGGKGITTLRTEGSTYDTLLAVYQVDSLADVSQAGFLTNLVLVADGEDDARNYASEVRFNSFFKSASNSWYYIAVDAFDGVGGDFVLTWDHEKTSHMLPAILLQPKSQTVLPGASVTFTNFSVPECSVGHLDCNHNHWEPNNNQKEKLTYQWYFNGMMIPGATSSSYTISSVQPEHVGTYRVRVFTPWQYLDSKVADLQINNTGGNAQFVQATDKFGDLQFVGAIFVGVPPNEVVGPVISEIPAAAAGTVARGYSGSQIFNTAGSATGPGEVNCDVIGGSSEWLTLIAEQTGTLFLNTDGSSYDTVMSVFQRNPTNAASLVLAACNNNGGLDRLDSAVTMPVTIGTTNYILIDGVDGVTGILQFNYSLATTTILKVAGRTAEGANVIQVNGRPGLNFSLQSTANLKNWSTVVTTNAPTGILNYTDMSSIGQPVRYYRALILP